MATVTVSTRARKGDPALGPVVNGFRHLTYTNPKLIAEAFDVVNSDLDWIKTALRSASNVSGLDADIQAYLDANGYRPDSTVTLSGVRVTY